MAAEGIAKRATIGVGFHTNQEAINAFEHSLRTIGEDTGKLRNTFNRTNLAMDRFNEHMEQLTGHNSEAMDRLREADNKAVEASRRLGTNAARTAAIHNHASQSIINNANRMRDNSRQTTSSQIDNMHRVADEAESEQRHIGNSLHNQTREQYQSAHAMGQYSREMIHGNETSGRFASANGRVARSFRYSNNAIGRHEQAIRDAQSHSYRWLRTAQDMSGATLGLGAAFYKGAKDATTLQQSYIHAGNMAHYGGEKIGQVQHDINRQWRIGSNLSIKYGISQDQIAKGYQALVARGYTTNESLHTQKSLLQAAIASGDNYNDVVKDSTNVLDAYNMRSNNAATMTNNTRKVVNEMAYAADQTATNFQGLGIGMSYVAATAHTTHQSISETSSALGILSNKGMQASQAGVGLRKVLNSFLSVNQKGQQAQVMKQLGLSEQDFKTSSGHLKSLGALMTLLNNKTKNMDSQERGAVFHRFFGATGQEAALNLASDTSGLSKLNDQVERSQTMGKNHQGYVALLSAHNMKSAQNQLHRFQQAWQAFTITAARELLPTLTHALKHFDVYLAKLNDLSPNAKKWTISIALIIAAIAPMAGVVFGIQSAFHGLEMTILHVRKLFAKPVSSNMNKSILKQNAEDTSSTKVLGNSKSVSKGGIGYKALSVLKAHPTTVGIGSAVSLGTAMGVLMGTNANYQAKKQVDRLRNQYSRNPIQEKIKAELDQTSVNQSLKGNKRFEKQLENQDKATVNNIKGLLSNDTQNHENNSKHNVQILRRYAHISKRQAKDLLRNNINNDKGLYRSANKALNAIGKDQHASNRKKLADYKTAYRAINRVIAGNGSKEKAIYERLSRANDHISTQTAARLLRNSYKTTHAQITNANNEYHKTSSFAWKRYNEIKHAAADEYGVNSKTYRAIVNKAAKSRNSEISIARTKRIAIVSEATTAHQRIMKLAEQQRSGLDHEVDLTTGHIKTEWSETFNWLKGLVSDISNLFNHITGGFAHKLSAAAGNASSFGKTHMATHAAGGAIPHTEMSLVNEKGQESAYNPHNNTFRLLGNNGPQVLKLYQGEHVLNAQDTRELLTTGLGRGVTLPGYANGTDKLSNVHGYVNGRGEEIAQSAMHAGNGGENTFNGLKNAESDFNPYSWAYTVPHDLAGSGSILHKATSVATDLPVDKFGHAAKGLKALRISKNLVKPLTLSAHAIKRPLEGLRSLHRLTHPLSSSLDLMKNHVHSFAKSLGSAIDPSALNKNFKKIAPMLQKGIDFGITKAKAGIHNGFNYLVSNSRRLEKDVRRLGRSIARTTGRIFRKGKRVLSRMGRGIARFGHHTWSRAKHLGRRLWTGTKHVAGRIWSSTKRTAGRMWSATKRTAGRMWNSAKRTGRNIWSNTKRVARNVGHAARSLWNRTKAGASRTWSHVVSGARRMAQSVGSRIRSMVSSAKSKARSAWTSIKSGVSSAVSAVRSKVSGMVSWVISKAHEAMSALSHIHLPHFANGGPIGKTTMALVGEHGPETAYDPHSGLVRLLGLHGPQITELLAGERVLTNTQTSRLLHGGLGAGTKLPAYANGTGGSEIMDNSSHHGSRSLGIVGRFSGIKALTDMKHFGKKAKSLWDDIGDYITKSSKDTHNSNNDEWQNMYKDLDKINDDLSKDTRDSFSDMSKKVGKLADDMHDGLVSAAEDMASGFGDKFKKLIDYAKHDMESVIDKLNKGIGGIDTALRAFGGNSHVIHAIHYATGSGFLTHNQIGILNDATSGPRQESILRNGQLLFPHGNDVSVPLHAGDAVLNGTQTKEISNITNVNHYAKGSGLHISSKLVTGITKALGEALKGPKKFFNHTFNHTIGSISGHQLTKGIEQMGMSAVKPLGYKWTSAMFNFIKSLINPTSSTSDSKIVNYANKYWTGVPYVFGGVSHSGADCGGAVMTILHHFGIDVPHVNIEDSPAVQYVGKSASEAQPGDLVGFGSKSGSKSGASSHIGIFEKPGKMWSEHPPKSGQESIDEAAAADGLWGYYRIKGVHNTPKHKHISQLTKLVSSELGPTAIHWLKKVGSFMDSFNGGGTAGSRSNPGGSGVERWRPYVKEALQANHFAASPSQISAWMRVIARESNGNPSAENDWDINAKEGHPSIGLVQTIGPTFDAYKFKGHDNIRNGFDDLLAGIHYMSAIYGRGPSAFARVSGPEGYANGGWASRPSIFGEAGPEVAINPNRDTADHLIVQAIAARMHHSPNSPIAGLVKSLGIRHKVQSLANDIKNLITDSDNPNPKQNNNKINIHLSIGNINIAGNPNNQQATNLTHKVETLVERGIQRAALRSRNRLDW